MGRMISKALLLCLLAGSAFGQTFTDLAVDGWDEQSGGSVTTGSVTWGAGPLVGLVTVQTFGTSAAVTVTVTGMTCTEQGRVTGASYNTHLVTCTGTPSDGTVTISGSFDYASWHFEKVTSVDTSTPVNQASTAGATTDTAPAITLSTFDDTADIGYLTMTIDGDGAPQGTHDWTAFEATSGGIFDATKLRTFYGSANDPSFAETLSVSAEWSIVAVEIDVADGGGGGANVPAAQHYYRMKKR